MSDIQWPPFLPLPQVDIAGEISSSVIRSAMDSGRVRQRQRSTAAHRVQKANWIMSAEQYQLFLYFHKNVLGLGAATFNITMPWFSDEPVEVEVRIVEGKFSESWISPERVRISAAIEQDEMDSTIDASTYEAWKDSPGGVIPSLD